MQHKARAPMLATGTLRGLFFIHRYRFLTIPQFAKVANFSYHHSAEVLREFEKQGVLGYFGFVPIPCKAKRPGVFSHAKRLAVAV